MQPTDLTVPAAAQREAFRIKDCSLVTIATGRHAQNLRELRDHLAAVDAMVVYSHFWLGRLQPRYDEMEYVNDFAAWAFRALHDYVLGERLAMVDPSEFDDLDELRQEVLDLVEERLDEREMVPWARPGQRFDFLRAQMVVFDTYQRISRPEELPAAVLRFSPGSLFYHLIDARRRRPDGLDDLRAWLVAWGLGDSPLVQELAGVDWHFLSLTELRERVAAICAADLGGGQG
ncbi:MAG TPA: DUF5752 family protein [Limnochordales bacterium]|nr:DUF5752 family protein [Limnochordales bacterium]